jgi:hypothetical protein
LFKWIQVEDPEWNTYIGMDGLCVYWGNILRSLGKVQKTIVGNRFCSEADLSAVVLSAT